jgi:steroid delta-isomerase-like uncharacterized protein
MTMSAKENESIARQIIEAFNSRDPATALELVSDHAELVDVPFGEVYRGPDGLREYHTSWMSAFPDGRVEITNVIADDRQAVVEYTGQGTMTGAMSTGGGDIPPTGRRMQMKLCDVMEIEDGKVIRYRSYFDAASMMQQLGLTSEPAAPQG